MDQEESLEARVDVKIKDSGLVEEKTEESFHLFITGHHDSQRRD